ncbi:MAG: hypothetical protein VX498_09800 [Myxococcota bacterium]|nr:hypothetical protein [Myxococcota bacterium]
MLRFPGLIRRLSILVVLQGLLLPFASGAVAETACIARPEAGFSAAAASPGSASVGSLAQRGCYTVLSRSDGTSRLWIPPETGFQGEVVVSDMDLAQVLVGDVTLRDSSTAEPWGQVLSGSLVAVEADHGDRATVVLVEGRLRVRFELSWEELFPASSWWEPDPDVQPDSGWPSATGVLPPSGTQIVGADRAGLRAEVTSALFSVEDLLLDPDFGGLRLEVLQRGGGQVWVRLVGMSAWVEGRSRDSSWVASMPPEGWGAFDGLPSPAREAVGDRQLGPKGASVHVAPKGAEFGQLAAGSWLRVKEENGSWFRVSASFEGGVVEGWVEKKRLVGLKKTPEPPKAKPPPRLAAVGMGKTAVQWLDPEAHEGEEAVLDLLPLRLAMNSNIEELRLAYARVLEEDPSVSGEITLRMVVAPSGEVTKKNVAVDGPKRPKLVAALKNHLSELRFASRSLPRRRDKSVSQDLEVWLQVSFLPPSK